ncbi:MAG TPA: M15 family metallopeptidase [Treponemataceae bacterium]|nr:M15 family metallopeptidase [Treponemataceae bacterium]HQL04889.1 M15 family metallopeptidase [Treponemataceae bacterium]
MPKFVPALLVLLILSRSLFSQDTGSIDESWFYTSLLQKAYPEKSINPIYDRTKALWSILITAHDKTTLLYWKEGRLLPSSLLDSYLDFDPIFTYTYADSVRDPKTFTAAEIENLRTIVDSRLKGSIKKKSSDFLLNALYNGESEDSILTHIVPLVFLGKKIIIHEDLLPALKRVQTRLNNEAKTDEQIKTFLESLGNMSGYNWRDIRDISSRSTHSWGISIDILPRKMNVYEIYWMWTKDINEQNWMKTPLKLRWIPPEKVISIFEEEGFVWGGKWIIWDNMHFEYRPDILLYSEK